MPEDIEVVTGHGQRVACAVVYGVLGTMLLAVAVLGYHYRIPYGDIMRDPVAVLGGQPFVGAMSNIGILLWCGAVAVSLYLGLALRSILDKRRYHFLLASAALSALMLFDDLFMIHEVVMPEYLGLPEKGVLACYGLLAIGYAVAFQAQIRDGAVGLFVATGVFFAGSLSVDLLLPVILAQALLADGLKLLGLGSWLMFLSITGYRWLHQALRTAALSR